MKIKELVKSGLLYTIGNIFIQGIAFLTLPIYTRMMSQADFGRYSLFVSWVNIIGLVIGLQTSGSISIAKVKFEEKYEEYSAHALSISNIFSAIVLIIVFFLRNKISLLIGFSENIVLILFLQAYVTYLYTYLGIYYIQKQKNVVQLFLSISTVLSTVILSLILIQFFDDDFKARVFGQFFPTLILGIFSLFIIYSRGKIFIKWNLIKYTLSLSLPLIFHQLGHQILNQLDRIMIGKLLTVKDVAQYSFGYSLGMVIQIVLQSLNTAWVPWYFEAKKKNLKNLSNIINTYINLALFLTLGYLTIFPELSYIMGGESYSESVNFIPLIILSYLFSFLYTFPVNVQFFHGNTKFVPVGTIFAGGLNAILNYFFIINLGIFGAAVATIISYFCLLLLHHYISRKLYKYEEVTIGTFFKISVIGILYSGLMSYFIENIIIRYIIGFIILIIYFILYKEQLVKVFTNIKGKK